MIAVIMECYLFIKHTVGALLTAFRNQLKQHRLLTLATLARGVRVCGCVHECLFVERRGTTMQYTSVSVICKVVPTGPEATV